MRRMPWLANVVWSIATAGAAACGRLGFDTDPLVIDATAFESRCGQAPTAVMVTVTNTSDSDLSIDALASGGFIIETALPLAIAANDSALLAIRAPAAVIGTDVPGSIKIGTLTVTMGALVHEVPLASTVVGASFALIDENGGPLSLTFGSTGVCPPPMTARLVNTGNTTAMIVFGASADFALQGVTNGALDPGNEMTFTIRPLTSSPCSGTFDLSYTAMGDVCDTVPAVLPGAFTIDGSPMCSCS